MVIHHGDMALSNVMSAPDGRIKFIDFQISQCGDPVVDVILFLFTSLRRPDTRRSVLPRLLRSYHEEFTSCVAQLGFQHQVNYSFEDFCCDFADKCVSFGLPRLAFALFLFMATKEEFEAAGPGGNVMNILNAVGARAKSGSLDRESTESLTSTMIDLLRMSPETLTT